MKVLTLKKRREFLNVKALGRELVKTPHFILQVKDQYCDEEAMLEWGIVIRKRIGKAVVRNRIKRRVRSILFKLKEKHFEGLSVRCVLIMRDNWAATVPFSELIRTIYAPIMHFMEKHKATNERKVL